MSDDYKRIIDYDAVSEARTDDNLLMDSPAVGTRKITATNLIKPAMDAVSNEETERELAVSAESTARQNGDTDLDGKKYGDFVSTTNVTIDGTTYKTFWVIAPTSSNQVYGIANHPTNGRLFKIYNNQGTYSVIPYDKDTTKGDEISTKVAQTGSIQTSITNSISADTTLDNAIGTLLNNDVTQDKQISDIESNLSQKASKGWISAGWGDSVTIPEDYTEALIYMMGRNTHNGTRRIAAQITFLPELWAEQLSSQIEFLVAGYYYSSTDKGYGSLRVSNNGKTFNIQGWTYGNGNAADTYVMVYYRK